MLNSTKVISSTQSNLSSNETPSSATEDHPENPPRLESRPPPNIPINTEGQRFREDSELFDDHEGSNDHQTIGELRNTLTTASLDTEASEQIRQDKTVSIRGRTSNQTKAATGSVASQYERLESAIKNGDIQTTKQLIDQENDEGLTPLMMAIVTGNTIFAKLLISNDAAIGKANKRGDTPLTLACTHNQPAILAMMLARLPSHTAVDTLSPRGLTLLMHAADSGNENIVKLLLDHGATMDMPGKFNWTALTLAAQSGHTSVVELLLDRGAMPDRTSNNGWTPLMFACKAGHTSMAKLLLAHGAMPDQVNHDGQTPLMLACEAGDIDAAELLLNRGARPDQKSKNGWTALMLACKAGHTPIAKLLLANDAVLDGETASGRTPLMIACKYGKVEIVRLLVSKADFFHTSIHDHLKRW
jgi:ankyrin repeat protein